jgi:hypothetical protein
MLAKDLSSSFNPVPKPPKIIKSKPNKIKNKSNKLAKLEKNRFSILTNNLEKCYFCENAKDDLHEVFRGRNRLKSIKWGLVIPICRKHHRQITYDKEFSKVIEDIAKIKFVKKYGEEKFIEEFK